MIYMVIHCLIDEVNFILFIMWIISVAAMTYGFKTI